MSTSQFLGYQLVSARFSALFVLITGSSNILAGCIADDMLLNGLRLRGSVAKIAHF